MVPVRRCLLAVALVLPLAALAQPAQWPVSTPEAQGMDSSALAALVDYGGNAQMDSLVVARNGKLVAEAWTRGTNRSRRRTNTATTDSKGAAC